MTRSIHNSCCIRFLQLEYPVVYRILYCKMIALSVNTTVKSIHINEWQYVSIDWFIKVFVVLTDIKMIFLCFTCLFHLCFCKWWRQIELRKVFLFWGSASCCAYFIKVIGRTVPRNNILRCLFIFISPLYVWALAGSLPENNCVFRLKMAS
jgi:hypothetical protein